MLKCVSSDLFCDVLAGTCEGDMPANGQLRKPPVLKYSGMKKPTISKFTDRNRPLGHINWEVEWCEHVPLIEGTTNEYDLDAAGWLRRYFESRDEAIAFAKSRLPKDFFGAIRVTEVEWSDPIGENLWPTFEWEPKGESTEITHDDLP